MLRGSATDKTRRVSRTGRTSGLLSLLFTNPIEFYDRVRARAEMKALRRNPTSIRYQSIPWDGFTERVKSALPAEITWQRDDSEFQRLYQELAERSRTLGDIPFPAIVDSDPMVARLVYMFTRALKPEVVVETGVALGVNSACILSAFERNGRGRLISVDLPPLAVPDDAIGAIVPDRLRSRWTLLRGSSTRMLPAALKASQPVGLFVQDSLFTWRNSTQEFSCVLPHLADRAVIIGNCVHHTGAFDRLVKESRPSMHAIINAEEKAGEQIGICVYESSSARSRERSASVA
jgi:hypothetical protein